MAFFVDVVFLDGDRLAREHVAMVEGVSVAPGLGYRASFEVNERLLGIFIGGVILVRLLAWQIMVCEQLC